MAPRSTQMSPQQFGKTLSLTTESTFLPPQSSRKKLFLPPPPPHPGFHLQGLSPDHPNVLKSKPSPADPLPWLTGWWKQSHILLLVQETHMESCLVPHRTPLPATSAARVPPRLGARPPVLTAQQLMLPPPSMGPATLARPHLPHRSHLEPWHRLLLSPGVPFTTPLGPERPVTQSPMTLKRVIYQTLRTQHCLRIRPHGPDQATQLVRTSSPHAKVVSSIPVRAHTGISQK